MKGWPFRLLVGGGILAIVAVVAVAAFGPALLRSAISSAGKSAGYGLTGITYERLEMRGGHVTIVRPDITGVAGAPLFTAQKIDVAYSLRDALRGPYLDGIHGLEIDRPKVTIVHYKDGSYNFKLPPSNGAQNNAAFTIPKSA